MHNQISDRTFPLDDIIALWEFFYEIQRCLVAFLSVHVKVFFMININIYIYIFYKASSLVHTCEADSNKVNTLCLKIKLSEM